MTTQRILAAVALVLFLAAPGTANAQYNFTTYDVPGSTRTAVNGNSPHAIAGEFDDAGGKTHGFVLSNGVLTQIDVPGASFTSVNGINANGDISGIYIDAGGRFHGYFQSNGVLTTLDPPGAVRTQAEFLNAQGQVVGVYRDANKTRHGFIWSMGTYTTFDEPDSAAPLMSYPCFSFLCRVAREFTQGTAERNQFCRRGTKSRRWRKIPTRTM